MKKVAIPTLIATVTLLFAQTGLAEGRGANRQFNQNQRICQGIENGELTRGEARRLQRQQHRIHRHQRLAWADGTFTGKERTRLERMQNRASKNIYRLKNNKRCRFNTTELDNS